MAHGFVKCGNGHFQSLEYKAYVRESNWNQLDTDRYTCSKCKSNRLYLVTNYDPNLSIEKFVVGTFGKITYRTISILERDEDSIRKVLTENNFVLSNNSSNYYIVYSSPEGYKAIFVVKERCKLQELFLVVPAKHEIISKIRNANKADKKARRDALPPKPSLPTKYKDCLDEEITIGDWVAYSAYEFTSLQIGKIIKINEKTVSIKPKSRLKTIAKTSEQIIKLSKERSVLLSLEM